jgi:hypothetical protein
MKFFKFYLIDHLKYYLLYLLLQYSFSLSAQQLELCKYYFENFSLNSYSNVMTVTSDNNILLVGSTYPFHGDPRYCIMKLSQDGDTLWFKTETQNVSLSEAFVVKELSNGNYAVGAVIENSHYEVLFMIYDTSGNLLIQKTFSDSVHLTISNIIEINTSLYLICKNNYSTPYSTQIIKTNLSGDSLTSYYDSTFQVSPNSSGSILVNNEFLLAGIQIDSIFPSGTPTIVKMDTSGNIIWKQNYILSGYGGADIVAIDSNNFVFSAKTLGGSYFFRIDSIGNQIWSQSLPLQYFTITSPDRKKILITTGELSFRWYDMSGAYISSSALPLTLTGTLLTKSIVKNDTLYYTGIKETGPSPVLSSSLLAIVIDTSINNKVLELEPNSLKLYPTICKPGQVLNISGEIKSNSLINIYNIQGALVLKNILFTTKNENNHTIYIDTKLNSGDYILVIKSGTKSYNFRFCIQ